MAFIDWNKDLELGIPEIDMQHKKLVEIINDLFKAMSFANKQEKTDEILQRLNDYTQYHFTTEEKYFDEFTFPDAQYHKEEHQYFIQKVGKFGKSLQEGRKKRSEINIELFKTLKFWLVHHIQGADREYAGLFKEKMMIT